MKIFRKQNMELQTNIEKPVASHLFIKLYEKMNKMNELRMSRKELVEYTKISNSQITAGLKELKEKDLVRKADQKTYMINPSYIYFGDAKSYAIATYRWELLEDNHARTV